MSKPTKPPGCIDPHFRQSICPGLTLATLCFLTACQLRAQGRLWWCACGQPYPWSGQVLSQHNSQHLFDPYSFSHMLHGLLFCGLLAWACPRIAPAWRLCLAALVEALWEVLENTAFVIERYRSVTASFDYEGDTVLNSMGDILSFGLGFALARCLGVWKSIMVFLLTELVLLVWIRDGLLLNVLMLLYPIEAVKTWQLGQ